MIKCEEEFNWMKKENLDQIFESFSNLFLLAFLMMNYISFGTCFNFYNGLHGLIFSSFIMLIWLIIKWIINGRTLKMANYRVQLLVLTAKTVAKQARDDFAFFADYGSCMLFGYLTESSINQLNVSRGNNGRRTF
uniref:Uncharacterized protein n=1 Tax=Meloidogyne enterolobii TaxID=390850 RepID=A0A6V7THR6_MELEN|nr:unnamed protein product [Meloidogyne enterolobii]